VIFKSSLNAEVTESFAKVRREKPSFAFLGEILSVLCVSKTTFIKLISEF